MGMIGCFHACSDVDRYKLLEKPERIRRMLYGEMSQSAQCKPSLIARLFGAKTERLKSDVDDWDPEEEGPSMDVDKAWNGIHYLLTGDPVGGDGLEAFIVSSGELIGDVDVGYGPARVFTVDETQRISEILLSHTVESLTSKCISSDFLEKGIYPNIWDEPFESCFEEYILLLYSELSQFVKDIADKKLCLISYIA